MFGRKGNGVRITALTIAAVLAGTSIPVVTYAKGNTAGKEEVIYVNLAEDGEVEGVYAVNIFTDKEITDYGDYEEVHTMNTEDAITYENGVVKITNTSDRLYYEGVMKNTEIPWKFDISYQLDGINMSADEIAGKSGALKMSIHIKENKNCKNDFFDNYALQVTVKLDTESCKKIVCNGATEANAGNDKQMTYTILPGKSKDIEITSDVTDFEMEAIAINGVRLNLDVSKDEVDTSDLEERITELQDGVAKLDDGANDLNEGAKTVDKGAQSLKEGINTINTALNKLNKKSGNLTKGSTEVKTALQTIQTSLEDVNITTEQLSALSKSSTEIKNGLEGIEKGLTAMDTSISEYYGGLKRAGITDIDGYVGAHNQAINSISLSSTQHALYQAYTSGGNDAVMAKLAELADEGDTEAAALAAQNDAGAVSRYVSNAGALIAAKKLLEGDVAYIQGSNALISGIDAALDKESGELMTGAVKLNAGYKEFDQNIQGLVDSLGNLAKDMTTLKSGIDKLVENYSTLDSGIGEYTEAVNTITTGYSKICEGAVTLVKGTGELYEGSKSMSEGTGTFRDETSGLQDEIDDKIDTMIDSFTGGEYEVKSFVSEKNTNVSSVQFVIQTSAVKMEEAEEEVQEEEKKKSVLGKLKDLF